MWRWRVCCLIHQCRAAVLLDVILASDSMLHGGLPLAAACRPRLRALSHGKCSILECHPPPVGPPVGPPLFVANPAFGTNASPWTGKMGALPAIPSPAGCCNTVYLPTYLPTYPTMTDTGPHLPTWPSFRVWYLPTPPPPGRSTLLWAAWQPHAHTFSTADTRFHPPGPHFAHGAEDVACLQRQVLQPRPLVLLQVCLDLAFPAGPG